MDKKSFTTPPRLQPGDEIRVIAPSNSLAIVSEENREIATHALADLGLKLSFGKNVMECDAFLSSSIEARIQDLHDAFLDPSVKGILTVLGGHNSNQLLSHIDYDLVRKHPKIFCGFSDITALQNAFLAQSNLVTYSGPHYSSFAMKQGLEYTLESFKNALFRDALTTLSHSKKWSSDSEWYLDQETRSFEDNLGPKILNPGEAEGTIVGGNLGTFLLLKGTPYMPSLENTILFIEETEANDVIFDRNLQSIVDLPEFSGVQALLIGRFEKTAEITENKLKAIIQQKRALAHIPIVYDLDFGHTTPFFTFPIGGNAKLKIYDDKVIIKISNSMCI